MAETYDSIGNLYLEMNNYSEALPYIKKSISIYQKNILEPKERLVSSLKNISEIYENIGNIPITAYMATHGFSDQFIIEYEV